MSDTPLPFSPYLISEWKGPEMIDRVTWTAYTEQQLRDYALAAPSSQWRVPEGWMVCYKYWDGWPLHVECQTGNQNGPMLARVEDMGKATCTKCGKPMINATMLMRERADETLREWKEKGE